MITNLTEKDLVEFETDIAGIFNAAKIRAPVHLYSGNEKEMIEVFRDIRAEDWLFCSWRSHYQCLLKGVSPDEVKKDILAGHSISLCFPQHRIFSSARGRRPPDRRRRSVRNQATGRPGACSLLHGGDDQ